MQLKLGDKIKELRRKEGRTQEALADALGVTGQAVSRWESNGSYPDMEIIPSLANFFGISIDELFGYQNERARKIDNMIDKITEMDRQNNGADVCVDACIRLAREGVAEFPGNEKMMLCLASVLYNAGYVRYGENHLTDDEGYDVYDVVRHRRYTEWKEAIKLYESVLPALTDPALHSQATTQLMQLYANTGEEEKAAALASTAPGMLSSREFLCLNACDGKQRATAYGKTLLAVAGTCSDLMVSSVMINKNHQKPEEAVQIIQSAIALYQLVFTDEDYGIYGTRLSRLYLYLSEHLWRCGKSREAFSALDAALAFAKQADAAYRKGGDVSYTSPLLRAVTEHIIPNPDSGIAASLPQDWPWWCVPDFTDVVDKMKADPRWAAWAKKTQE